MSRVLAIDPGSEQSAYVIWDGAQILDKDIVLNNLLRQFLMFNASEPELYENTAMVIEEVCCYGMAVGRSIFETVFWTGRFCEAWPHAWHRVPRMEIKMHHCHDSRAKDPNIRIALIDRFGGKEKAIGKKANPGVFYGVKADIWSALAIGIYWWDINIDIKR
ncbi:hypothetical protein LCGC14_1944940 [marine sediment metagenome]|uniref:Uncharacterized protein n=1 Tax=marine sediment metagenome TaxID=412755 RepID=A0A0F9IGA0_9ZZZZ